MNVSIKLAACVALVMFVLPASSAFARDPKDPGQMSQQCIAQGGEMSVGDDADSYDCDLDDGSTWSCDFSDDEPDCDTDFTDATDVDISPFFGHHDDHHHH